jgi:hypothetical protein
MDRNSSSKREYLSNSEVAKRQAPGRLTRAVTSGDVRGAPGWTPVGSGSPAAIAGQGEHEFRRARPDLVARRAAKGK